MRTLALSIMLAGCADALDLVVVPPPDAAPDASPLPEGLILWYTMDELDGIVVADNARDHDATCSSCPGITSGRVGGALAFDGVEELIRTPGTVDLVTVSGLTVAAWLKIDAITPGFYNCPVNKQLGARENNSWNMCVYEARAAFLTNDETMLGSALPIGEWHHLAMLWDGTTKSIYIDGVVDMSGAGDIAFDHGDVSIGADLDYNIPAVAFGGAIDDVRIYDRVLSTAEIAKLATP